MKKPVNRKSVNRKRSRTPVRRDPLVDEVRRIRAQISEEYGHDVDKLCDHLRDVQASYGGKVVHKRGKRSSA